MNARGTRSVYEGRKRKREETEGSIYEDVTSISVEAVLVVLVLGRGWGWAMGLNAAALFFDYLLAHTHVPRPTNPTRHYKDSRVEMSIGAAAKNTEARVR